MEKIQNFSKGLNLDTTPVEQPEGTYINAYNIEIINDELQGSLSISNSQGNKFQISIPSTQNIYKLSILTTGTSNITIHGIGPFTFTASTGFSGKDLYNFIVANPTFGLGSIFNAYYSDNYIVIVPIINTTFTITSSNLSVVNSQIIVPSTTLQYPIGYGVIRDDIYIYSTPCIDKDPQTNGGGYGFIWKLEYDNIDFIASNAKITLVYAADLNFTTYYNIPQTGVVGRYENILTQRLYWTDNYNPLRSINVKNTNLFALDRSIINLIPSVDFDIPTLQSIYGDSSATTKVGVYQSAYRLKNTGGSVTNYSELSNIVTVVTSSEAESTGGGGPGLDWSQYTGANIGTLAKKQITWKVDNIDRDFDIIEFIILFRDGINSVPTIVQLPEVPINDDSIIFTYNGTQKTTPVTLSEFNIFVGGFLNCKTIGSKDNRLFAANIKNIKPELISRSTGLPYDTRAFRSFTSGSSDIWLTNGSAPNTLFTGVAAAAANFETEDVINDYVNKPCYYKPGTTIRGGAGLNISYEFYTVAIGADETVSGTFNMTMPSYGPFRRTSYWEPDYITLGVNSITNTNTQVIKSYPTTNNGIKINDGFKYPQFNGLLRGYHRGEIYRFGIQFYDKSKNPMFVKWIGDIKMPDFSNTNTNSFYEDGTPTGINDFRLSFTSNHAYTSQCFVQSLGIKFTVNNLNEIQDQIDGYSIVRVKREEVDKSIVAQGYITRVEQFDTGTGIVWYSVDKTSPGGGDLGISPNVGFGEEYRAFFVTPDQVGDMGFNYPLAGMNLVSKFINLTAGNCTSLDYTIRKLYTHDSFFVASNLLSQVTPIGYNGNTTDILSGLTVANYTRVNSNYSIGNAAYYLSSNTPITYDAIGYKTIYNIERTLNLTTLYSGNTYINRASVDYISCGHFRPVRNTLPLSSDTFEIFGGDTYVNMYDSTRLTKNYTGNPTPNGKAASIFILPVESSVNTDLRHGVYANKNLRADDGSGQIETYDYNSVYSAENNIKLYFPKPFPFNSINEFDTRFMSSEIKINGELTDSWTTFLTNNYWDVEGVYGPVNSMIPLNDKMYFWQDRSFGVIEINPRAVVTDINNASNSQLQLGTGLPLQRHDYITVNAGTKHQGSTISSYNKLYWYDSNTFKMWNYSPGEKLEPLSDVKGLYSFFRKNLNGRIQFIDKPTYKQSENTGVIATYDNKRHRAIFTFNDTKIVNSNIIPNRFTIAINELTDSVTTFYSFTPLIYINDGKEIFSTDDILGSGLGLKNFYIHNHGDYNNFYGIIYDSYIKFIVNPEPTISKVFDNFIWDSQSTKWIAGADYQNYNDVGFTNIRVTNDYQNTDTQSLINNTNVKRKERNWKVAIPRNRVLYTTNNSPDIYSDLSTIEKHFADRIRDKYIQVELWFTNTANNYQIKLNNFKTLFRGSNR